MIAAARRRLVLAAAVLLLAWSAVVLATGGVAIDTAWGLVSSRAAARPFAAGVLLAAAYLARWRRFWRADLVHLGTASAAPAAGVAAGAFALVCGLGLGTWIAGGPDASGYVSQASMLARGELTRPAPQWALEGAWRNAEWSGAPVGYVPSVHAGALAPTYPPGLPLLMTLFQVIGGAGAVFWVVPLAGAVAAWATWRLGARLAGPAAGAVGAVLLVSSPPFVDMVTQPMSDVPAAAFWAVALLAATTGRPLGAGLAAAVAVLVRPNLVPLAAIPAALLLIEPGGRVRRLAVFAAAASPAALAVAALNTFYFGSPLLSGYGTLEHLYDADRIAPNLLRYGAWILMTQTPLALAGLAAPLAAARAGPERTRVWLIAVAWPIATLVLYLPYLTFDEWAYLRFLLPGYVGLFAGAGCLAARWRAPAIAAAAAVALYGLVFAADRGAFDNYEEHRRFRRAVDFVAALPGDPVLLSNGHSGTLHHYTGRDILRFELLDAHAMDAAVAHLAERGRDVYFVGDPFEFEQIDELLRTSRTMTPLARAPRFDLGGVVVYALTAGR